MLKNISRASLLAISVIGLTLLTDVLAKAPATPPRERVIWAWQPSDKSLTTGVIPDPANVTHLQCKDKTCNVPITVTVDPNGNDPTGRTCKFADTPFVVVTKKKDTVITWTLTEKDSSRNAKFADDAAGRDGIKIYLNSSSTKGHFKNRDRKDKTFGWERDYDAADEAVVYFYDINIDHNYGKGKCDVPDPIIVNRD